MHPIQFWGKNAFGDNSTIIISVFSIILFWFGTWVSTKGAKGVSKVTNVSGVARVFIGVVFILLAFIVVLLMTGGETAQSFSVSNITPKFDWKFFATMAWILQAVGGAESIGVYIKDVKGGNKSFVKTMVFASVFIGAIYALGCIAVGMIVPESVLSNNYSNGLFDAVSILGSHFGINYGIGNIVGLIMLLSGLGSLVLWTAAPAKVLFSEIPKGIFGEMISKTDKNGTPVNALWIQAIVVTILLIIPACGIGRIDSFLQTLINMTAATSLIPVLFFIIAYIVLRLKKDNMPRSFKMVNNRKVGIAVGIMLLILFLFTFFVAILPNPASIIDVLSGVPVPDGEANPLIVLGYNIGGVIIFLGFALYKWGKIYKK